MQQKHKKVVSDGDGILAMARKLEVTLNETVEQKDKLQTDLDNLWKDHHALQKRFNDKEGNVKELEEQFEDIHKQFQEMEEQKNGAQTYAQRFSDITGTFLFVLL